jgi:magnesium transporter
MLRYFVKRSKSEDFEQVHAAPKEDVWVRGGDVSSHELQALADTYGLDFNILHDVLDKNELPRVEVRDGEMYVFVRSVERGKHGKVTTTPILLAVKGSVFLNVSTGEAEDVRLAAPSILAHATDPMSLLLGSFAGIVNEYEILMQRSAHFIKDTGNRLRSHEVTNADFVRFVTVEDNLNEYRMNLNGMLVVAQRIKDELQKSKDREAVEDIVLYIRQLLVAIESHNQSITSIRNAYGTIANNTLNHRMKTLTVLTLLVALPNVFYGMYGMNIALPFQDSPWAYGLIVGFTLIIITVIFLFARRFRLF